jgi:hypothetical protein
MDAKSLHTVNSLMPFLPTFLAPDSVHFAAVPKFAGVEL